MTQNRKRKTQKKKRLQRRWTVFIIVLVSLLFRGIYFLQLNDSQALLHMHKWSQSDMHYYHEWAEVINDGDLLTDRAFYPYNFWQKQVANYAFNNYPNEVQQLVGNIPANLDEESRNRLLWEKWVNGKTFYTDPFYAYWVAANFKIFGVDVRWVFFWQLLLGVCSNVLIYLIAARYFGERTGIIAAAMAILCAPLMYNEMILIRSTWLTFSGLLLVYLLDKLMLQKHWKWWLLYGILLGVCMLLKSVYSLWLLYALGLTVLTYWGKPKQIVQFCLLLIVGMYIGRAPLMARNLAVGLSANSSSAYGSISFILTNHQGFDLYTTGVDAQKSVDLMITSEGKMSSAIQKTLQTHDSYLGFAKVLWQKFEATWNGFELTDNANFYYYRLHAPILKYLFLSFYWIAPLGIVGFFLALFHQKRFWRPLYAFAIMQVALLTLFFVLSRLRVPLVAIMIPFAAYAVSYLLQNKNVKSLIAALGILLLAYWVHQVPPQTPKIRHADYVVPYQVYYKPLIQKYNEQGDWQQSIQLIEDFLQYQPSEIANLQKREDLGDLKINRQARDFYGRIYEGSAYYHKQNGDLVKSEILKAKANLLKSE